MFSLFPYMFLAVGSRQMLRDLLTLLDKAKAYAVASKAATTPLSAAEGLGGGPSRRAKEEGDVQNADSTIRFETQSSLCFVAVLNLVRVGQLVGAFQRIETPFEYPSLRLAPLLQLDQVLPQHMGSV